MWGERAARAGAERQVAISAIAGTQAMLGACCTPEAREGGTKY